jgi:hypothetical protein
LFESSSVIPPVRTAKKKAYMAPKDDFSLTKSCQIQG